MHQVGFDPWSDHQIELKKIRDERFFRRSMRMNRAFSSRQSLCARVWDASSGVLLDVFGRINHRDPALHAASSAIDRCGSESSG
jgi:hypothetical protein